MAPEIEIPYKKNCTFPIGSSLTIKGIPVMPFSMAPELQVDFLTGTDENADIALSFRVYFGTNVVMNSRQSGDWMSPVKYPSMPFVNGQPFELRFVVLQNEYQIYVNGRECFNFSHRLPPTSVKMIQVWRDASLSTVEGC